LKSLCQSYSIPNSENKIIEIKYIQYSLLIKPPEDYVYLVFILKISKDTRSATKEISIKINKKLLNNLESINDKIDINSLNFEKNFKDDISDYIMIEQIILGNENLQFQVTALDSKINLDKFKYSRNIRHFISDNQYLNGINEIYLRVKQSDLLKGVNKIILKLTNHTTGKYYFKTFDYEKGLPPNGGDCRVEPNIGYSLQTNFYFSANNWNSRSKILMYKIKFQNKNNILFDLSNGGFSKNNFKIDNLPVGNKLILEVIDIQGYSTIVPCEVNIKKNKNLSSLDSLLDNIVDISEKLLIMEIYQTNLYNPNGLDEQIKNNSIIMLDNYFENLNLDDFYLNYDKILSTLITITFEKLLKENILKLYKILNQIMKYIYPLMNDLNKIEYLFKILDNLNKNAGFQLQSM